jgi:hypothetical protein
VIIKVDFDATFQLLIIYSTFVKYLRKWEYSETVHQLFINFKKGYDSVIREVLYNILNEFGVSTKLIKLTKCSSIPVYESFKKTLNLIKCLKRMAESR